MRINKKWAAFFPAIFTAMLVTGTLSADFGDNRVGINTHIPADDVVDACVNLGVSWIRVDNNWIHNQTTSGPPSFIAPLDNAVSYAVSQGLDVFMTIAYTPEWASSGNSDERRTNDVPIPGTYGPYTRQAVAHYRAMGVTHFGLWNETNLDSFWEGTAQQYVDLIVVPGMQAIDEGCADAGFSDCLAMGPELAHIGDYDVFLEEVMNRMDTAGVNFDIYVHHTYGGFPETGKDVWDGDRFFNALDQRRFWFTRRSFIDVMTDAGHAYGGVPDKEVWITETGYHCEPAMDEAERDIQEIYYMRVIDEQLARPWYTNTFFYEILDSLDELDGFGIIRRESGPDSTWEDNFFLKEAYLALKDRIAAEPAFYEEPCEFECCDGLDNDGDTLADMADPGCSSSEDDDEGDDIPPPIPTVQAIMIEGIIVDGNLDEWTDAGFISLASPDDFVSPDHPPPDASGLSCRFAAMWDSDDLFLAVEVTDNVHDNTNAADTLWAGDSIQAAFDIGLNGGMGYDGTDDFELGWAEIPSGDAAYRWEAPGSAPAEGSEVAVAVSGGNAVYEIRIPSSNLNVASFSLDQEIGFTMLVNDADGAGRTGWIEWTPGIGSFKDPGSFGRIRMVAEILPEPVDSVADIPDTVSPDSPDMPPDAGEDATVDPSDDAAGDLGPSDHGGEDDVTYTTDGGSCSCSVIIK